MGLEIVGGAGTCWISPQAARVACHLDSFGLRAQIAPKPTELYDLPVVVDLDPVGCQHVTRFRNALHLEDLHLDNPAIVIASDPGDSFCRTADELGKGMHRPPRELSTPVMVVRHVNHSNLRLFRSEKPLDQLVFEAISFSIVDQAGFPASLDIGKGPLQRRGIPPLALGFLPHLLSNPCSARRRRERQRKNAGDQAHTDSPASWPSTNE
jgi:hypothetical protein